VRVEFSIIAGARPSFSLLCRGAYRRPLHSSSRLSDVEVFSPLDSTALYQLLYVIAASARLGAGAPRRSPEITLITLRSV